MASITIKETGYRCERCGHEWVPRGPRKENRPAGSLAEDVLPALCPKCKSPYWQTKRKPPKGGKK